jgi:hypothetical protein
MRQRKWPYLLFCNATNYHPYFLMSAELLNNYWLPFKLPGGKSCQSKSRKGLLIERDENDCRCRGRGRDRLLSTPTMRALRFPSTAHHSSFSLDSSSSSTSFQFLFFSFSLASSSFQFLPSYFFGLIDSFAIGRLKRLEDHELRSKDNY